MPDLRQGIEAYTRIGFQRHPAAITERRYHNAIAVLSRTTISSC